MGMWQHIHIPQDSSKMGPKKRLHISGLPHHHRRHKVIAATSALISSLQNHSDKAVHHNLDYEDLQCPKSILRKQFWPIFLTIGNIPVFMLLSGPVGHLFKHNKEPLFSSDIGRRKMHRHCCASKAHFLHMEAQPLKF